MNGNGTMVAGNANLIQERDSGCKRTSLLVRPFALAGLTVLLLFTVFSTFAFAGTSITWIGGSGTGNWSVAANWSLSRTPTAGDDVFIPAGASVVYAGATSTLIDTLQVDGALAVSSGTLTVSGGDVGSTSLIASLTLTGGVTTINTDLSVGTLVLGGATLQGSGDITITTLFDWNSPTGTFPIMQGTGKTVIATGATANLRAASNQMPIGRPFENYGTVNWTASVPYLSTTTTVFTNHGLFKTAVNGTFSGSSIAYFVNAGDGIFQKTGSSTTTIGVRFDNDGTVEVQGGTLRPLWGDAGSTDGTYRLADGAGLDLAGGLFAFTTLSSVVNTGTAGTAWMKNSNAAFTFAGTYDATIPLTLNSNVTTINTDLSVGTLVLGGATLQGSGDITITTLFDWNSPTGTFPIMQGTGKTVIATGATANLRAASSWMEIRRTFENYGTVEWTSGGPTWGPYLANASATFINHGTFRTSVNGVFNGTGHPVFVNASDGTFIKAGNTTVRFNWAWFDNDGTVEVQGGTLYLYGDGLLDFSGDTLSGGRFVIGIGTGSAALMFSGANIRNNQADITLNGSGAAILNQTSGDGLSNFTVNGPSGVLTLKGDKSLTTHSPFSNVGRLSLEGSGTVTVPQPPPAQIEPGGFFNTGELRFAIAGTGAGAGHGQVRVLESAVFGGTLRADLLGGFVPVGGDEFPLVTYASRSADFASVLLPTDLVSEYRTNAVVVLSEVVHVPPAVGLPVPEQINPGETYSAQGSFFDPNVDDTFTATVDYGDGSGPQALVLNPDKTFALTHVYPLAGAYTVMVTVTDNTGESGAAQVQVAVNTAVTLRFSGSIEYLSDGAWHPFTKPTMGLVPGSYPFKFDGHSTDLSVVGNQMTKTIAVVRLLDSGGATLSGGVSRYYDGSWHSLGAVGSDGSLVWAVDGLKANLAVGMSYANTYAQKWQDVSRDSTVVFQTVPATLQLKDSTGALLDQGTALGYYSNGTWNVFEPTVTTGGQASMELLPGNYAFRLTYAKTTNQLWQDVGKNATVVFQTVPATLQLKDSTGALLDQGTALGYYSNGTWNVFEPTVTTGGQASMELLPGNYAFRLTYAKTTNQLWQDVGKNATVVFQTVPATLQLKDSTGALLDQGTALGYYSNGTWNVFEPTVTTGGQASMELLPGNYAFRLTYAKTTNQLWQDVGKNATVVFQTGRVISDSGTCTRYYSGAWYPFTNSMELLPGSYAFQWSDKTPQASIAIIKGMDNHLH